MKKIFLTLTLILGLCGIAQASSFEVGVGATTNKVQHGQTISERGFSTNLNVVGKTASGIYGQYGLDTVSFTGMKVNLQHTPTIGYATSIAQTVNVNGGVRARLYTGGATTVSAKSLDYAEAFAAANAYGANLEVRRATKSKDVGIEASYKYQFADNCAGRVGYEYINYGTSTTNYNGAQVGADYKFTKNLTASLDYFHTGKNSTNVKLPNQVAVSVAYLF